MRPVLILNVRYREDERAVVTYVGPRTTNLRGTQYEVPHPQRSMPTRGIRRPEGLGSIPDIKLERRLGTVDPETMDKVENTIRDWLAL